MILCFLCYELPFSVLKLTIFVEKNYQFHIVLEIIRILDEFRRAQCRTREEEENLVAKKTPMAKVEKRQKQEEEAADKMKQAEIEYKAKIDVANQKQNKIKDETSNTARELQVYTDSPVLRVDPVESFTQRAIKCFVSSLTHFLRNR